MSQVEAIMNEFRERQKAELERLRSALPRLGYDVEGKSQREIKEIVKQSPTKPAQP